VLSDVYRREDITGGYYGVHEDGTQLRAEVSEDTVVQASLHIKASLRYRRTRQKHQRCRSPASVPAFVPFCIRT